MRLLTFLESVETDRENAAYARRVADGIQEYLNLNEGSKVWGMKPVQREGGIVTMTMGVIPDMLRKLDWSEDDLELLDDLHLLLITTNHSELAGGYGKWQGKPIIILELLHPEKPMTYVNTRFSGRKKHFMHELTHHLDSVRTQDKAMGIAGRFKPEELKHNMAAYLSNPKEFNAYFIEVLEELDSVFFRVIPKIEGSNPESARALAQHVLGNNFQEFVNKLTKQMFGAEFVMDDKYRKKFVRRLAKHYMDIVKTLRAKGLVESSWSTGGTGDMRKDALLKLAMYQRQKAARSTEAEKDGLNLTENPTQNDLMRIVRQSEKGVIGGTTRPEVAVKGVLDPTSGIFYIWQPSFGIHGDLEEMLMKRGIKPKAKDWAKWMQSTIRDFKEMDETGFIAYSGDMQNGELVHWMPKLKPLYHPSVQRAIGGIGKMQDHVVMQDKREREKRMG